MDTTIRGLGRKWRPSPQARPTRQAFQTRVLAYPDIPAETGRLPESFGLLDAVAGLLGLAGLPDVVAGLLGLAGLPDVVAGLLGLAGLPDVVAGLPDAPTDAADPPETSALAGLVAGLPDTPADTAGPAAGLSGLGWMYPGSEVSVGAVQ
ncbi:hypothetical protein [Frankia sp. CcI49]|uniref:hypothetical protein n=1 Tax=Frankia sp. CcI49 TaxID=1745382 RepID=UPI0010552C45|nr:hypothetical protein [Frankia sp. CcI49]